MTLSSSDLVCPEKRLLVCCARTRIEPHIAKEIRDLAAGALDWDFLLSAAAENSILPLLARQLSAVAPDVAAPNELERLKNASRANALRCLVLTAELIKIMDLFQSQGIEAIPYKGPILAVQAYGDVTLREFEDIDIVLRQRDMAKANEIVLSLGYHPKFPWTLDSGAAAAVVPGEYNYRDEARRMMVELHTEWTLRHFPVRPNLDDLARRLVPVALSGHELATFGHEDLLPILCIHGSKDFWERISWIADISEFIRSHPQLDWDQVFRRAEAWRAGRMLRVGLALTAGLLDAPLPEEIMARVRNDRVATSVASEVAQSHLRREWSERDAAARFHFRRRMVAGIFAGWRYSLRLATLPAEEDGAMMRLPPMLAPLYGVLRPLRLLRKYGSPGRRPQ
ncbi:MAG: nucleotidyltransferase family protein [Candidatus Acidoferrales bacterium]|nr:nucleotidyltransferase family protein [Candidatus Acidoferrales bacterium]